MSFFYILQLHSGDFGALSGLSNLTYVGLIGCVEITGKENSSTVLLGEVPAQVL
jgi:hypothetical protein